MGCLLKVLEKMRLWKWFLGKGGLSAVVGADCPQTNPRKPDSFGWFCS